MKDKKVIRQQQAQLLMRENAIGVMELAACIGLDDVKLNTMVGDKFTKQLPDSTARLIEQTFNKPMGWMDSNEDGGISFDLFG
jgi:hypothetical protein